MADSDLYSMIIKQRENRQKRDLRPFNNFINKFWRSEKLLKAVTKSIKDKECLNEALYHMVISDCTAFEIYFKDIFTVMFKMCDNQKELLIKFNKKLDNRKFDIEDLVKVKYENFEVYEIIAGNQNFQNLKSINKFFSIVLDKDFCDGFNNRIFQTVVQKTIPFTLPDDWYPKIQRYLDLRHNLIHDFNPQLKLNKKNIEKLHSNLSIFIVAADIYLHEDYIEPNLKDEFKKSSVSSSKNKIKKSVKK